MQDTRVVEKQKQELLAKMRIVGEKYGWVQGGRPLTVTLTKTLSSYVCERRIRHLLENADFKESQRFDPYYRQKSEFATIRILEHIKTRVTANGLDAVILTEAPSDFGRYDVVVTQGYPCKVYANSEERVRIEVKASLGLDLEQLERYLWDPSPLILARVITRHVAKIEPLKLQSYVLFSLRELNAKAERLLSSKFYTIPGTTCTACHDNSCPHNRSKSRNPVNVLTMPDSEFAEDLKSFFLNLSYVAEKTANLVVEELESVMPSQNNGVHSLSTIVG